MTNYRDGVFGPISPSVSPYSAPVEVLQDVIWEYDACISASPSCVIQGTTLHFNQVYRAPPDQKCFLVLQ